MRYERKQFYLIGMWHKNHFEDSLCKEWYLLLNILSIYCVLGTDPGILVISMNRTKITDCPGNGTSILMREDRTWTTNIENKHRNTHNIYYVRSWVLCWKEKSSKVREVKFAMCIIFWRVISMQNSLLGIKDHSRINLLIQCLLFYVYF